MQLNEDYYEPEKEKGLPYLEEYWKRRNQSSRAAEQAAILLAMAQGQADELDPNRFPGELRGNPILQTLQVCDVTNFIHVAYSRNC